MTLTPETGAGLANANSYASLAEAEAFHESNLRTEGWATADTPTKQKALVMATRHLDGSVDWLGERGSPEQALEWPRSDVQWRGQDIAADVVPQPVKNATAELARLLINTDLTADSDTDGLAEMGLGQGAVTLKFREQRSTRRMPAVVDELLQGYGTSGGGGITLRKVER
jgi:hypothetical protein